jgi:hypothetical protein
LGENFNKNYRLSVERLYGRRILENHDFRKESARKRDANNIYLSAIPVSIEY